MLNAEGLTGRLRLFHSGRSPFVRKVMIAAIEVGVIDRILLEPVLVAPKKLNLAVMGYNPLVKLPTMVLPTGEALYGSDVICAYLDAEGDGSLFPASGPERWRALRQQALADGLMAICNELRQEEKRANCCDAELVKSYERRRDAALKVLDSELAAVSQGSLTIGHVAAGSALSYLDFRLPKCHWRRQVPKLGEWFGGFLRRPSMQRTAFVG